MTMYNLQEIKSKLTTEQIFELLTNYGGNPTYSGDNIISETICHNAPGDGSPKLYYYANTNLFRCWTGCEEPLFDIFELTRKVFSIQKGIDLPLHKSVQYVAEYFGFSKENLSEEFFYETADMKKFKEYEKRHDKLKTIGKEIIYKPYDISILNKLSYPRIKVWEDEGISKEVIKECGIGYYAGDMQITIPHYDYSGNFIGLRGRALIEEDYIYGKYRPIKINGLLYTHALGGNLYNLDKSKDNITSSRLAIVFESEKSCLKYRSAVGAENDISVACCGSSLTNRQFQLLKKFGADEIAIAFDKDFTDNTSENFKHVKRNLLGHVKKYNNDITLSLVFDKENALGYKDSPIDRGIDIFAELFRERIRL